MRGVDDLCGRGFAGRRCFVHVKFYLMAVVRTNATLLGVSPFRNLDGYRRGQNRRKLKRRKVVAMPEAKRRRGISREAGFGRSLAHFHHVSDLASPTRLSFFHLIQYSPRTSTAPLDQALFDLGYSRTAESVRLLLFSLSSPRPPPITRYTQG